LVFAGFAAAALLGPATGPVGAQEGFILEEVVVTARKREESLQDTPVAVSAFTAQELQYRQIDSTDRLGDVTPNLTFDSVSPSSGSSSAAQIFIRGIGQTDFTPVTDPGVGLYIDGVYMARSVGNVLDFLDVDRVEVLRGPQGTLFGRNTIGGAVVIHSKRPTEEFGGSIKGQFGDDDMVYVTGKINVPVTDGLAANLAYAYRDRDGYVTRTTDGIDTGDDDSHAVRGSVLWDALDNFAGYLTFDYSRIRENGAPTVSGGVNDTMAFGTFGNGLLASCTAIVINNGGFGPPAFGAGGPPSLPPPGVGAMGAPGCFGSDTFAGEFTSQGTFPVRSELDVWGVSGELTWEAADWLTIKSITGYREMEMESSRDGDNTPANIFATQDFYDHQQISQEVQFSGRLLDERLQWLFGLYYFQEDGFNINPVTLPVGAIQSGGLYDNESLAAFFQGTYSLTDRLDVTFGVRYTDDTKRFTPDQIALGDASMGVGSPFPNTWTNFAGIYLSSTGPMLPGDRILPFREFEKEFDDVSIMINFAYNWTDELMTYFTYSEGFKSGGFDQRFAAPPIDAATGLLTNAPDTFDPEFVKSYELGFKSQWLENRLRLNAAFFFTDYEDLQIIIRETFNPITFNGGEAEIKGAEFELTWVPTDRWYITAALGYIDAEYGQLSSSVLMNATPVLPDNSLVNTPEWSTALGVAYSFDVGQFGTLTPRVDWSFHDEQYNDAVNTPQLKQDSYHMLNAALTLETNDGQWEAVLAFRNILDEEYLITGNSAFQTAASYVEQVYGRPFEWSISLEYKF
jgi:iron complex outermembrane receptor protein